MVEIITSEYDDVTVMEDRYTLTINEGFGHPVTIRILDGGWFEIVHNQPVNDWYCFITGEYDCTYSGCILCRIPIITYLGGEPTDFGVKVHIDCISKYLHGFDGAKNIKPTDIILNFWRKRL